MAKWSSHRRRIPPAGLRGNRRGIGSKIVQIVVRVTVRVRLCLRAHPVVSSDFTFESLCRPRRPLIRISSGWDSRSAQRRHQGHHDDDDDDDDDRSITLGRRRRGMRGASVRQSRSVVWLLTVRRALGAHGGRGPRTSPAGHRPHHLHVNSPRSLVSGVCLLGAVASCVRSVWMPLVRLVPRLSAALRLGGPVGARAARSVHAADAHTCTHNEEKKNRPN